jgi:hypothetical protein
MIRVGLITTVAPERCGLRVYAEELVKHGSREDVSFELIGRPFDGESIITRCQNADIIHVLHVWALFGAFTARHVHKLKAMGKKTVCTFNDSMTENRSEFTLAFDRVVVHQPTGDGFTCIYHGVPIRELNPSGSMSDFIGTSGFPFEFKNYPLAARLARAVGMKLYANLPVSQHVDARTTIEAISRECPGSLVQTNFPPHDEIIGILSNCAFSLFPYRHETTGIGGSARVGIGAQRPVVISNVIRFADLLQEEFRDEFYVIPSAYPTFEESLPVVQQVVHDIQHKQEKIPIKTLKAMSWKESAAEYVALYRELYAKELND